MTVRPFTTEAEQALYLMAVARMADDIGRSIGAPDGAEARSAIAMRAGYVSAIVIALRVLQRHLPPQVYADAVLAAEDSA